MSPDGSQVTSVIIAEGITNIGAAAFSGDGYGSSLTNVSIPASVISIGDAAFAFCQALESFTVSSANPVYSSAGGVLFDKSMFTLISYPPGVGGMYTIPVTVTNIADNAFDASALTNITIPTNVTAIGASAFDGSDLGSVAIPGSVQSIGAAAFYNCPLTNVTMEAGIVSIDYEAFVFSGLRSVTIPGTVTRMGVNLFQYCYHLGSAIFERGVPMVPDSAFYDCYELTNVIMADTVTRIEYEAFVNTGLRVVIIPASVNKIDDMAFVSCSNLIAVFFEGNAPMPGFHSFDANVISYYLPGTTGWEAFSTNTGLAVVLWNPLIQTSGSNFGVSNGQFGFDITGTTNIPIVVEAATNLVNPAWIALQTFSLTNGSVYFSDPQWTNYPGRFYRISSP